MKLCYTVKTRSKSWLRIRAQYNTYFASQGWWSWKLPYWGLPNNDFDMSLWSLTLLLRRNLWFYALLCCPDSCWYASLQETFARVHTASACEPKAPKPVCLQTIRDYIYENATKYCGHLIFSSAILFGTSVLVSHANANAKESASISCWLWFLLHLYSTPFLQYCNCLELTWLFPPPAQDRLDSCVLSTVLAWVQHDHSGQILCQ